MTQPDTTERILREITRTEALQLLASVPVGRVVFTDRALPAIRPVNHVVDDGHVIIRSHTEAAILSVAERGVVVAYEADMIDPDLQLGWSVVVTGVAQLVRDPASVTRYRQRLRPWVGRSMDQVIAISADIVTGFALIGKPAR